MTEGGSATKRGGRSTGAPDHAVRRRDRAKDEEWIKSYLTREPFGFLASVHEGRPFVNSNLFVFDEPSHSIYLHTARIGRTSSNVTERGPVCFSVASMGRLLPAEEALEFSVEYSGVVVFGTAEPVEDPATKRWFLERLLEKYSPHLVPGKDYRPITDRELERTGVHAVRIEGWSGKEKVAAEDFPGAYPYSALSALAREEDPGEKR